MISAQPEVLRPKLEQVRAAIRRAVPEAQEVIGYGIRGYKLNGKPLLYFAGFKQHYSLFAASGTFFASLEKELKGYEQWKGNVHFQLNKPVPVQLISRIAKLRAAGFPPRPKKEEPGQQKGTGKSSQKNRAAGERQPRVDPYFVTYRGLRLGRLSVQPSAG